jgi:hypothetical protein
MIAKGFWVQLDCFVGLTVSVKEPASPTSMPDLGNHENTTFLVHLVIAFYQAGSKFSFIV